MRVWIRVQPGQACLGWGLQVIYIAFLSKVADEAVPSATLMRFAEKSARRFRAAAGAAATPERLVGRAQSKSGQKPKMGTHRRTM